MTPSEARAAYRRQIEKFCSKCLKCCEREANEGYSDADPRCDSDATFAYQPSPSTCQPPPDRHNSPLPLPEPHARTVLSI